MSSWDMFPPWECVSACIQSKTLLSINAYIVFLHTREAVGKRCWRIFLFVCLLSIINWELKGLSFSKTIEIKFRVFHVFWHGWISVSHVYGIFALWMSDLFFLFCVCVFMHMKACKQIWLGLYDDRNLAIPDFREPQKVKEFLQDKYEKKRW